MFWQYILCEPSIFEKVFIWFLGQPVVWSEPNISQIEAWSLSIYAWYQELELEFLKKNDFFLNFKQKNFKVNFLFLPLLLKIKKKSKKKNQILDTRHK
jgi:hypothetical protein